MLSAFAGVSNAHKPNLFVKAFNESTGESTKIDYFNKNTWKNIITQKTL